VWAWAGMARRMAPRPWARSSGWTNRKEYHILEQDLGQPLAGGPRRNPLGTCKIQRVEKCQRDTSGRPLSRFAGVDYNWLMWQLYINRDQPAPKACVEVSDSATGTKSKQCD